MQEIFKDIPGYEGLYQVSNLGRVRSLDRTRKGAYNKAIAIKGRILKSSVSNKGYELVGLCKNSVSKKKTVHRLVMLAFIPNPNNLPIINHIDGDKLNNNISNLEWCDYKHNSKEAARIGLIKSEIYSKLTTTQVKEIKANSISQKDIAKLYKVHPSTISRIKLSKRWKSVAPLRGDDGILPA